MSKQIDLYLEDYKKECIMDSSGLALKFLKGKALYFIEMAKFMKAIL